MLTASGLEVLAAIYFDNDLSFEADDVEDVVSKWDLPAKLEACEPATAQQPPHRHRGICRILSQATHLAATALDHWSVVKSRTHDPSPGLGLTALATLSHKGRG